MIDWRRTRRSMTLSIVVADDHPMLLDGIGGLLAAAGYDIKARCLDGQQARDAIKASQPDLALLDVHMPHMSGLDVLREARRDKWKTRIVILTASRSWRRFTCASTG